MKWQRKILWRGKANLTMKNYRSSMPNKFREFSLSFCRVFKIPWVVTKFPEISLIFQKKCFSLSFPGPWEPWHYKSLSVYSQISSTNTCERVRSIPSFYFFYYMGCCFVGENVWQPVKVLNDVCSYFMECIRFGITDIDALPRVSYISLTCSSIMRLIASNKARTRRKSIQEWREKLSYRTRVNLRKFIKGD